MVRDTRINRYISVAVVGLLGIAVFVLAWPRLQASYRYLPVEIAIQRYFSSREIPSDRLPVLVRFATAAIAQQDHYRYHDGLSLLHLLRAQDLNTPALERLDEYQAAAEAAVESLQRAPAQPGIWLRLANVRWILHEEPASILAPWKMSIFTGRTDTTLFAQRIDIGLSHREYLDEEALAMLRDQVLLAWRIQPGSLVGVLSRRDKSLEVTRH
jgi:hypothetical protein